MINLKTKIISTVAMVSLVGSPLVGLAAQTVTSGVDAAKAGVKQELDELKAAREAFKETRTQEAKERETAAKEKVEARRKTAEEKRAEAEKRREEQRKEVLLRLIDVQVKYFENVAERVARMPNVSDAQKAQLKTEIDKAIASLNALKAKVEAATTAEELKTLAQQIRDNLKTKREIVKKIVDAILISRLSDTADKADERIKTAEEKITELKAAGKDVAALEKLLDIAKQKLSTAKTELTKQAVKAVQEALKEVYKALRELSEKTED